MILFITYFFNMLIFKLNLTLIYNSVLLWNKLMKLAKSSFTNSVYCNLIKKEKNGLENQIN